MDSPKTRFCLTTHAKQFTELTLSPVFTEGCDVALAQFHWELPMSTNLEQAASLKFQMEGARRLMTILQQIGKPEEIPEREPIGVLRQV